MTALHCGYARCGRELELAGLPVARWMGTAGRAEWRLGATARLLYDIEPVAHPAAARGQGILAPGNGGEGEGGRDCRDFRCGVDETLTEGRRLVARSVCGAVEREWMGDAVGDAWF